jgi:hypothetical protein
MTHDQLFNEFEKGFPARKFSAGLLIAFVDLFKRLDVPALKAKDFAAVLAAYPRQTLTSAGKRANTLIVAQPSGGTLSLRPFYNEAERFFRAEHKRFDYPSCAPHATQAWADYVAWLDALATFSPEQLDALRARVAQFVLDMLRSQAFDPSSVKSEPALFKALLEGFEMTAQKGEPTGAAFQGVVFGFLRADNPHLQIEIDKVRTGSKRLQRVGDIDGWEGARLAISAEVKQFELKLEDVPDLEAFANETGRRGALGVVAALGFKVNVRETLEGMGLKPLDTDDLLRIVGLWDPLKQRTATTSLVYYARHVEKNSSLADRLDVFLLDTAKKAAE